MKKPGYAKKMLALLCSATLALSMLPANVYALEDEGDPGTEGASQQSASLEAETDQVQKAAQVFEIAESEDTIEQGEVVQQAESMRSLEAAQAQGAVQLASVETHTHDGIIFDKELDASMSSGGTLDSGNYYLTEDIALESFCSIQIPSGKVVNICLNGHVIKPSHSECGIIISGSLTLYDCSASHSGAVIGNSGDFECIYINSGSFTMNSGNIKNNCSDIGGGVFVNAGTFTMNGGSITGCSANAGGAVCVSSGSFIMSGGSITGCSSLHDGGVYIRSGSCTLGGTAQITGNQDSNTKEASNVYLSSGSTLSLGTGTDAPAQGMSVGIALENGKGAFTGENAADYSQYFTSDNSNYAVSCGEGNVLSLMDPAPAASDFLFFAPDKLTYDGQAKEAQFSSGKQGIGGMTLKYYDSEGNLLNGAPVNAGTYTVKLDVSEGTSCASVKDLSDETWTFTITPKSLAGCAITKFDLAYVETGREIKPSIVVGDGARTLEQGIDYAVTYSDNTAAGTAAVSANGTGNYEGTLVTTFKIVTLEESSTSGLSAYTVGKAGGDASVVIGEGTVLDPGSLKGVSMDGETLDSCAYTVRQGSIEIVLDQDYLNTLTVCKHVFSAELDGEYEGMTYEAEFTVKAAEGSSPAPNGNNGAAAGSAGGALKATTMPATGDGTGPAGAALLVLSIASVVAVLLSRRRTSSR